MKAADGSVAPGGWKLTRTIVLVVVVLLVGVGALLGSRIGQDPALVDSPLIGTPAPTATLPALEGADGLSLSALRGRIVVVNFWASWCVACREEHPALVAANDAYRDSGVTFVGVDFQDQAGSAVAFLDELGRGPGYRYLADPGSRMAVEFGVYGVPETFFVDRTGIIVAKITGGSTLDLLSGVLDSIIAGEVPDSVTAGTVAPAPPSSPSR